MAKKGRPFTYQSDDDRPVTISVRLPAELADLVQRYRAQHGNIQVSELIREGLEWRIGDGDPRGTGLYLDQPTGNREQVYDSNTAIAPAPQKDEALQEVRALLAQQWEQIQALAQALERQTTPAGNSAYDSNTTMPATDVAISYQEASYTEVVTLTDEQTPESAVSATIPPAGKAGAEAEIPHEGNTVIQHNIPAFDTSKYVLGKLCPRGHAWGNTGKSLLRRTNRHCGDCDREKFHERKEAKRQEVSA